MRVATLLGFGLVVALSGVASAMDRRVSFGAGYVDCVDQFVGEKGFGGGGGAAVELKNVTLREGSLVLAGDRSEFPVQGVWTGPSVLTPEGFDELLATFNVTAPEGTGVVLEVQVLGAGEKEVSPWLFFQSWGRVSTPPSRVTGFEAGKVDVDILELKKSATGYRVRVTLESFAFEPTVTPAVRRVTVTTSGKAAEGKAAEAKSPVTDWARDLKVPFRGQGDPANPRVLWSQICSPTSVSMVMEYYGVKSTTLENALAIYDPHFGIFGNWGRAVSRAGEAGCEAWIERFRTFEQVKEKIAAGVPVIASIRFKKGEVQGFLYDHTPGHLIVIRGMTPAGDFIVNDPARRETGEGQIYRASEMKKAWIDKGGVGYVITR